MPFSLSVSSLSPSLSAGTCVRVWEDRVAVSAAPMWLISGTTLDFNDINLVKQLLVVSPCFHPCRPAFWVRVRSLVSFQALGQVVGPTADSWEQTPRIQDSDLFFLTILSQSKTHQDRSNQNELRKVRKMYFYFYFLLQYLK